MVEEIHQARQQMLADEGGDIEALMEKVRAHQAAQGGLSSKYDCQLKERIRRIKRVPSRSNTLQRFDDIDRALKKGAQLGNSHFRVG